MKYLDAANDNDIGRQIARTRQVWQPRLARDIHLPANERMQQAWFRSRSEPPHRGFFSVALRQIEKAPPALNLINLARHRS